MNDTKIILSENDIKNVFIYNLKPIRIKFKQTRLSDHLYWKPSWRDINNHVKQNIDICGNYCCNNFSLSLNNSKVQKHAFNYQASIYDSLLQKQVKSLLEMTLKKSHLKNREGIIGLL